MKEPFWSGFWRSNLVALLSCRCRLVAFSVVLSQHRDETLGMFVVETYIVALCTELFVKAIAANEESTFVAKEYGHNTTAILRAYAGIPIFKTS